MTGTDPQQAIGRPLAGLLHPDDCGGVLKALRTSAVRPPEEDLVLVARLRHVDAGWTMVRAQVRDLRGDPDVGAVVLYCRDVTEVEGSNGRTVPAVRAVDAATGLPNRSDLARQLAGRLRTGAPGGTSLALIGLSARLDDDPALVRELTASLARTVREDDWLARAGTSQFAVLVPGTVSDAETLANRLVDVLGQVPGPGGTRIDVVAGVTGLTGVRNPGEALQQAELALRIAGVSGGGRVWRYSDAEKVSRYRREELTADLARALQRDQLQVVFQPVVDLPLHRVSKVEALLRWHHPFHGHVSPAEFIPLAEESGLIGSLGRWVLGEATTMAAGLADTSIGVAVNISAQHAQSGELVSDVLSALNRSHLPASRLVLEVTESLLLDDGHTAGDLQALRALGVRIAVDDFGTGWSSLAYLTGLPIDVLKLDRQFVAGVEGDPQRRALCRAVLELGDRLGLEVIVEGVERASQLEVVRSMGHRYIQGFLLACPMDAGQLAAQLADPTRAWGDPAPAAGELRGLPTPA
jgi:EAL domain-containing protein (putative c-di-GMP-specific phosphodiesterase class I)